MKAIPQGSTVLTPSGYTGTVLAGYMAINEKHYTIVHLSGEGIKRAERKFLTENLTVLDRN